MSHIHSLASSTGTRVDSASRHNMACKVHSNLIQKWIPEGDPENTLHIEKMRYCVHKDELVMNVSQNMFSESSGNAYPLIVSNIAKLDWRVRLRLFRLYSSKTPTEFFRVKDIISSEKTNNHSDDLFDDTEFASYAGTALIDNDGLKRQIASLPAFTAQGFAQGIGYASHLSGDTVCTVMIGGMMTVMNGAFPCNTGDMLQWYFSGEEVLFSEGDTMQVAGERGTEIRDAAKSNRKRYRDQRSFGMDFKEIADITTTPAHKASSVFRIKPYRMYFDYTHGYKDHFGDKIRIFAKCIGSAKPYEMMDVMLMTQSL